MVELRIVSGMLVVCVIILGVRDELFMLVRMMWVMFLVLRLVCRVMILLMRGCEIEMVLI